MLLPLLITCALLIAGAASQSAPADVSSDVRRALTVRGQAAAVVLLSVNNKDGTVRTIAQGASGPRRVGQSAATQVDDVFAIASCSKSFTATVLAAAVTAKRVSWDDTIPAILRKARFTPPAGFQPDEGWQDVTLRHVLHHRAGFARDTDFNALCNDEQTLTLCEQLQKATNRTSERRAARAAFAAYHLSRPPVGEVGTYSYSNVGYDVASWFAEILNRGAFDFEALLSGLFFKPLNLTAGTTMMYGGPGQSLATYRGVTGADCADKGSAPPTLSTSEYDWWFYAPFRVASGGLTMSMRDLATWIAYHIRGVKGLLSAEQHKIVSQQAFVDLHTPWEAPDAAEGGNYALGWLQNTALDRFFHDGSYQGFRTIMLGITEPDVRGNYYAVAASTNLREDLSLDDPYSGSCADAVTSVFPGLTDRVLLRYFNAPLRTAASGSRVLSPPPSPPPSPPSPADEPPLTGPADGPSGDPGGDTTTAASKGKRRREMEAVLGRGAVAGVAAGRTEHDVAPGAHVRPQWQRPAA